MTRMQQLEQIVAGLYGARNPARADWSDWLVENHVFLVADNAVKLAGRFKADRELSRAAALLHDIADTRMSRFAPEHEASSLALARHLMQKVGYTVDEVAIVVDDAIKYHSCFDGNAPFHLEGKVLATADAMAHVCSDFYLYAAWTFGKDGKGLDEFKRYACNKIDRDFNNKIQFNEVRAECLSAYDFLKHALL